MKVVVPLSPKEEKSRPVVFRTDDDARVLVPKFVKRVGYPKSVDDYMEEVRAKHGATLDALFREVLGDTHLILPRHQRGHDRTRWREQVERELAHALAHKHGFGGCERSIHWEEMPELEGAVVRVWSVRTAYTGTYYPPSGGGWLGVEWDDYEPGGLFNMKCHRIASVSLHHAPLNTPPLLKGRLDLEIPVYHLEKLER